LKIESGTRDLKGKPLVFCGQRGYRIGIRPIGFIQEEEKEGNET
jgi:hypothetical protein